MASLVPSPKMQFLDANGNPLASGKLYTYASGTSTPLATYTDSTGNTENAVPPTGITLDSRGEASVWLGSSVYRFVLTDSSGNQIWDISGINGADAATLAAFSASGGSDLVGFLQAGSGATARTLQDKTRECVSVKDFGATGDGSTDDTAAIQAAIIAARAAAKPLFLNAGTYKITDTLSLTSADHLIGDGKDSSIIDSFVAGAAIKCSTWGGVLQGFGLYINNATGNGIELGNNSRNGALRNLYLQVRNAYAASATGSGIYLNAYDDVDGFSGGLEISTSYVLGFKYGVRMRGNTPLSENTWTSVCMYNLWLVGHAGSVVAGSAGVYMNAGTNGIGTCMFGGTIEGFAVPIVVEDGSFGGVFETDIEGNTSEVPTLGNTFSGRVVSAAGTHYRMQSVDSGSGAAWYKEECPTGASKTRESYYSERYVLTSGNQPVAGNVAWKTYHNASLIEGNPVEAHGLKFEIGIGQGGGNGAETHPSDHYIRLADNKIHWGPEIPSARTGSQIVVWKAGDVWLPLPAVVGQPTGGSCTVDGTTTTGTITTGTNALTLADAGDIADGESIRIVGAGAAGADLSTTVTAGGGTVNLTLADNAGTSVADADVFSTGTWESWANL